MYAKAKQEYMAICRKFTCRQMGKYIRRAHANEKMRSIFEICQAYAKAK